MVKNDYLMKAPHRDYPNAMAIYGVVLTVFLKHLATCYPETDPKMVTFADDLTSAGEIIDIASLVEGPVMCWPEVLILSKIRQDNINC